MGNVLFMATAAPEAPRFEEGFTLRTMIGAIFIALFMLPGGMYLGLVAGQGVGEAAEWVTIVLFAEVARRSYKPLRKQEIYILFYIAASLTSVTAVEKGLSGGPFSSLIWNAFFIQSQPAQPIAASIPHWAIPPPFSPAIVERTLWHVDWLTPILLLIAVELCTRICWMGLGYALFRVTSDVEKLPFPYAPVAASGATALSEAGTESWRWRVFSTGSVIGLLFGLVYVGVPIVGSILVHRPVEILPIPFADYTTAMQNVLPAAVIGLSFSLGNVLMGMILPFEIVLGATISSVLAMVVANPILYKAGLLPHYQLGSNAFMTKLSADMDVWLSVGIGVNLAIAILGIALVFKAFKKARQTSRERRFSLAPPEGRGDIPIALALLGWLGATVALILICHYLVPNFPVWILAFFGLVWSPLNSYISARMIGMTGRGISFPYLKEASVIGSGYRQVDIWYAPIPLMDQGWAAQRFREVELTGTKITSLFKAELFMFPIIILASFLFWAFFWKGNAVPSSQFPYASRFWPFHAQMQAVMMQVNREGGAGSWFAQAIKPTYIGIGAAGGLLVYGVCSLLKLPLLFFYGLAGGIGAYPAMTVPQLLGAWFGRRFLRKRYGETEWTRMTPVLFAGFACGSGLIAMLSIAIALIAKAVDRLPY